MSYRRTYPASFGADTPAPKTSIFNLVGMDKFIKVEKTGEGPPSWLLWAGGAVALVTLFGAGALVVRKKKGKAP